MLLLTLWLAASSPCCLAFSTETVTFVIWRKPFYPLSCFCQGILLQQREAKLGEKSSPGVWKGAKFTEFQFAYTFLKIRDYSGNVPTWLRLQVTWKMPSNKLSVWWWTPIILALGRLGQEDLSLCLHRDYKDNPGCVIGPCLKSNSQVQWLTPAIPAIRMQRQQDLYAFGTSIGYLVSWRLAWATMWDPVLSKQQIA